jgi:hypothetical protein
MPNKRCAGGSLKHVLIFSLLSRCLSIRLRQCKSQSEIEVPHRCSRARSQRDGSCAIPPMCSTDVPSFDRHLKGPA